MIDRARRKALAPPLASAFLAGAWTAGAMSRRGREVVAERWIPRLAREVLAAYAHPPRDRPRELVAYIEIVLEEFEGSTQRPRRHFVSEGEMVRARWPVPLIHTVGDLATWLGLSHTALDWFADVRGYARKSGGPLLHYHYAWLPRRTGPPRLLEVPKPRLKAFQRRILHEILDFVPAHPAAHGFVRGRSAVSNAGTHTAQPVVVCLDLRNFFAAVQAGRVYGIFRTAGYPEAVAHTLTGLCTTVTPQAVTAMAADPLRRALATPHLPQGAPTSPALANLVAFGLDRRLTGLAAVCGATYTRYADDLAFSGPLHTAAPRLLRSARRIAADEGFSLHDEKTRFMTAAGRQRVTGIVVNVRPNVVRGEYDSLRALLHDARLRGPEAANRAAVADFRGHVAGRVAWVASVNPARGARLRAAYDAVAWTGTSG
jgi:hypothetical protein